MSFLSIHLRRSATRVMLLWVLAATSLAAGELTAAERYLEHVKVLTAADKEGRGAGTRGLNRAADYVVKQFRNLQLQPAGSGSYRQPFTVTTGARLKGANRLVVDRGASRDRLELNQDYIPLSFSALGAASGPLVFAGYGISAPEFGYDDYLHLDVKDKMVVVLRYEPEEFAKKSGQGQRTHHAHLITKAINARNHGARAVVLVNGKVPGEDDDALLKFGHMAGPTDSGILMVQVKNAIAEKWLQEAGKSLSGVQQEIERNLQPQSFGLPGGMRVSLEIGIERTRATVNNILGYLPGETEEYVIVGAHYDHLGRGSESSLAPSRIGEVHPGADDNASGSAALLEVARHYASSGGPTKRGILFAAFAGEEIGLLGSAHWVNHPTRPLEQAVAMINMDMVGRIKESRLFVGGVGTGSTFKPLLEKAGAGNGLKIESSPGGYAASDHTSFVAKRVPVLFFFSGLHSDYHKPSDTWEKINASAALQLLALVEEVTGKIASADARPEFISAPVERASPGGGGGGYGPWFGSVPDFGEVPSGVKFADVMPNSPAAKAGLKAGDILVQFGDRPIKNLYDFTDALRRSKVGEVVEVKCLRNGETVSAKVTLEKRK